MKGVVGGSEEKMENLVIPVVGLAVLSMLVPLVFLLGLHNGPHSTGDATQHRNSQPVNHSTHVDDLIERLAPTFPKEIGNISKRDGNETDGFFMPADLPKKSQPNIGPVGKNYAVEHRRSGDESDLICEFAFGSYCLWRREHKEKMEVTVVKRMKDLLFVARAYYPSIVKLHHLKNCLMKWSKIFRILSMFLAKLQQIKIFPLGVRRRLLKWRL